MSWSSNLSVAGSRFAPSLARWGTYTALVVAIVTASSAYAEEVADAKATSETPSYYKDVRPILQAHCQGCHQPAKPGGQYVMTEFARMVAGGESTEAAIVPGKPDASQLVTMITPSDGEAEMPKGKPPLSQVEIDVIRNWIEAGAEDDTPASAAVRYDQEHPPVYDAQPIITSIDFSRDGQLLAVSGYHEVLLHHANGSGLAARFVGMSERIESVAFSPDGKWLAVSGGLPGRMGEIQIWDVTARELKLSVPVTFDSLYGASWSPDSKLVAFGCTDNSVRAIDAATGVQVLLQRAPNDWTLDTVFSVDGSHLVSVGRDMAVKLIHVETERFIDNITSITPGALKGGLFAVARHPQRDEVLVGGDDGVPRAFRMFRQTDRRIGDDSNLLRELPAIPGRIFELAYHPSGKQIAAASSLNGQGHVTLYSADYDIELPQEIKDIESKTVDQRNDEEKKKLRDYRAQGVAVLASLEGQGGSCYALAYSPDGSLIASAGFDGLVRIHETTNGKLVREFAAAPLQSAPSDNSTAAGAAIPSSSTSDIASSTSAEAAQAETLPAGLRVVALHVAPEEILLQRSIDYAQLLITATLDNGEQVDVTRMVNVSVRGSAATEPTARVTANGRVHPVRDGASVITVEWEELHAEIPVRCEHTEAPLQVDYVHDVMPAVSRMGCNSGTCHGGKDGKNGFKLSLRGYDPIADTRSFADDLGARRINRASPASSLMLLKATSSVPHAGGQVTTVGSDHYRIVQAWIAGGVKLDLNSPRVASIELFPKNPVVSREKMKQQLRVLATYTDGEVRDVTREAFVTSGNGDVATVDNDGLATALRRGEAPMLARFEGAYTATTMTVMGDRTGYAWQDVPANNHIDTLVYEKLKRTKTLPSPLCNDQEFVRRVYLDLTGLPPTLEQFQDFVHDPADTQVKRDALIDHLVGSPEFIEHWTNKWADLLQVNRKYLGPESAKTYRDWIRGHIEKNTPYDDFVYQILTASGSNRENPAASYYKILREPDAIMENTTHLFLATRFNCNKCHDHPFERWTQDQYYQMTAYFARVGLDRDPESGDRRIGGTAVEGAKPLYEIVADRTEGETIHERTGQQAAPQFPYAADYERPSEDAPMSRREELARWITSSDNQYFATSYVNRIWGYLTGTGLIEPIDDIRAGNPPSNPELLRELTDSFIASGFDTHQLMRTICKSRTYQLSVETNKWNEDDTINFSHAKARRLPAEVLFDAIHLVTGATTHIPGLAPGTRAAELPDVGVSVPGNFLDQFGRPPRESACECERSNDVLLGPVLAMINGPTIANALADRENELAKLVARQPDDRAMIEELFLRILNRPATDQEIALAQQTIAEADSDRVRLEAAHQSAVEALAAYQTSLPDKINAWAQGQYPPEWQVLDLNEFASTAGSALTKESDGSWTITGRNGKGSYEFNAATSLQNITGFRLEVLTDPRQPKQGPGRADDGNFVLTEFRVTATSQADPNQSAEVKLHEAKATHNQGDFDVSRAIDGKDDDRGWAIAPQAGNSQTALFATQEQVGFEGGTTLRFVLEQNFSSAKHSLGRLRMSVTNSPRPHRLDSPPADLLAALRTAPEERDEAARNVVMQHYRQSDEQLRNLEAKVDTTRQRVATQRLIGAQDIAWALINSPAFLFNR